MGQARIGVSHREVRHRWLIGPLGIVVRALWVGIVRAPHHIFDVTFANGGLGFVTGLETRTHEIILAAVVTGQSRDKVTDLMAERPPSGVELIEYLAVPGADLLGLDQFQLGVAFEIPPKTNRTTGEILLSALLSAE